jgi:hypothetical protein
MTSDNAAQETAAPGAGPQPSAVFETFEFGMVVDREEVTITFPGMDPKWYVRAKAPDAAGTKRIEAAPLRFSDKTDGGGGVEAAPNTYALYIAKCEAQITDFCLPEVDDKGHWTGKQQRFDHKYHGANKDVYDKLSPATVTFVEGALDRIAGRETSLARQYDELKNASGPSASTG